MSVHAAHRFGDITAASSGKLRGVARGLLTLLLLISLLPGIAGGASVHGLHQFAASQSAGDAAELVEICTSHGIAYLPGDSAPQAPQHGAQDNQCCTLFCQQSAALAATDFFVQSPLDGYFVSQVRAFSDRALARINFAPTLPRGPPVNA